MNRLAVLATSTLLAGFASAQNPTNQIGCFPGATQLTSRAGVPGAGPGDILLQVRADMFHGVGNTVGTASALRATIQDQNLATQDPWNMVILADDGTGSPDITPGNEIVRTGNFVFGVGSGVGPFTATITFATPVALPQTSTFYCGVGVGVSATPIGPWPTDGLSLHVSLYNGIANATNPSTPGLTYSVDTAAVAIVNAGIPQVHNVFVLTEAPVLEAGADVDPNAQAGAANPNFGPRGYFHDRSMNDGFATRVRDAVNPNATFAVLGQITGPNPAPFAIPGLQGTIYLNPGLLFPVLLASGSLDAAGESTSLFIAFPFTLAGPFSAVGGIGAQAIIDPFGGVPTSNRFSNFVLVQDN